MSQARAAHGNISAEARTIGAVHYTVSVWESERAMKRFLYQAAHGRAIRDFQNFATGKTHGFEAASAPSWSDVPALLEDNGRAY